MTSLRLFLLLITAVAAPLADGQTYDAAVTITGNVINTVKPLLFGDNIEWLNNGMGLYNPGSGTLDAEPMTRLKDLGITHMRYPGGTLSDLFHWNEALGETRVIQQNPFGAPQYPNFGPDEFAAFCEEMACRQTITLNAGDGTAQMAADWVAHCNAQGYDVVNFCIGNEIYMEGDPASPMYHEPEEYRDFWLACYDAIQLAAPGTAVGAIGGADLPDALAALTHHADWLQVVIPAIKDKMAFLDLHNAYAPVVRNNGWDLDDRISDDVYAQAFAGQAVSVRRNLDLVYAIMATLAGSYWDNIGISISESGPLVYGIDDRYPEDYDWNTSLVAALYQATLFNLFSRDPKIAQVNHLPFYQGVFGALVGVDWSTAPRTIWKNAVYYVFQMYAAMADRDVLDADVASPTYDAPAVGFMPPLNDVPYLDAAAFRDEASGVVTLFLINRDVQRTASVTVDPDWGRYEITSIKRLSSSSYLDRNTAATPNAITPTHDANLPEPRYGPFTVELAKHSLAVVEIAVAGEQMPATGPVSLALLVGACLGTALVSLKRLKNV